MLPWLTYCILIFVLRYRAGVVYVLYIINTFFGKTPVKIIPRIIAVSNSFFVVYVLYIINRFLGKIPINILPQFAMPVSTFFDNYVLILSIDFCTFLSRYSTFYNACLYLFINCPLRANQSVYI